MMRCRTTGRTPHIGTCTDVRHRSLLRPVLILLALLLGVALLDDPSLHNPQPGPNAKVLTNNP